MLGCEQVALFNHRLAHTSAIGPSEQRTGWVLEDVITCSTSCVMSAYHLGTSSTTNTVKMSELTKALIQFHKDVDKIEKNARANYGKFADLANVLSTVTPPLLKNGLVLTQTFLEGSLITTLRHVGGEEISSCCKLIISEGRNKSPKSGARQLPTSVATPLFPCSV